MKKYITTLVFISFLGLAVFSIPAFNHKMSDPMDNGCIGSKIDNTSCPTNLMAAVIHHISVYQAFFNALAPSINSLILLTLLALVVVSILLFDKDILNLKLKFLYQRLKDFELIIHKARQKFVSWLSLLENSPSFL